MTGFFIILAYVLAFCETLWYFTCTKHDNIPLIIPIIIIILCCIPGFNCVMILINIIALGIMISEKVIQLKDNWFNRKFLAYHE
jgi:hypothetical protein